MKQSEFSGLFHKNWKSEFQFECEEEANRSSEDHLSLSTAKEPFLEVVLANLLFSFKTEGVCVSYHCVKINLDIGSWRELSLFLESSTRTRIRF